MKLILHAGFTLPQKSVILGAAADRLRVADYLRFYSEAIRLKPDYADAFNSRGNARRATRDFEGAIADYSEAIRLRPDYADAFNNRGNARDAKGDFEGTDEDMFSHLAQKWQCARRQRRL